MSDPPPDPATLTSTEPPKWGLLRVQEAAMSVQNIGILATLIGLLLLLLSPYQAVGLTLLIVGAVVAIVGIITRK